MICPACNKEWDDCPHCTIDPRDEELARLKNAVYEMHRLYEAFNDRVSDEYMKRWIAKFPRSALKPRIEK